MYSFVLQKTAHPTSINGLKVLWNGLVFEMGISNRVHMKKQPRGDIMIIKPYM